MRVWMKGEEGKEGKEGEERKEKERGNLPISFF